MTTILGFILTCIFFGLEPCLSFQIPGLNARVDLTIESRLRPAYNPFFRGVYDVFQAVKINRQTIFNTSHPVCNFPDTVCNPSEKYRRPDGYCNNLENPAWGSPGWPFRRMLQPKYDDGHSNPRLKGKSGRPLPSAREISRTLHTLDSTETEDVQLTSLFTHFGQFLDHDLDLTPKASGDSDLDCCNEENQFPVRDFYKHTPSTSKSFLTKSRPLAETCYPLTIPQPDPFFSTDCMNFVRSKVFAPSFKCPSEYREQGNAITSFIDCSQIYGSTADMQRVLRLGKKGLFRTAGKDMLPVNTTTKCRATKIPGKFCVGSGDVRVNEQPMLTSLHVVFHRYHNMLASYLTIINRNWDDEKLFQEARKITAGIMQHIIYTEYLPLLLGQHYTRAYSLDKSYFYRYDKTTDPRILNSFATAAFRFGHSMVPGHLKFGTTKKPLESMFFDPHHIEDNDGSGLTKFLQGTLSDYSQGSDRFFPSALSQKLFIEGTRSLDLVSLNIQRGRDHGLPPYNDFREKCGLPRLDSVSGSSFLSVYEDVDDVDLFSGALGEKHVEGGVVGDTFACIIARQFKDLKFGDRFWYENLDPVVGFTRAQLKEIRRLTFASIICQVTDVKNIQPNVFKPVSRSFSSGMGSMSFQRTQVLIASSNDVLC